jgi:hypothetical protein
MVMPFGRSDAGLECLQTIAPAWFNACARSCVRGTLSRRSFAGFPSLPASVAIAARDRVDSSQSRHCSQQMNRTGIPVSSRAAVALPALGEFSPSYGKLSAGILAPHHCRRSQQEIKRCFGRRLPPSRLRKTLRLRPATELDRRLPAHPPICPVGPFPRLFVRDLRESVLKILPVQGETASASRQGKRCSRRICASQSFDVCCCLHVQAREGMSERGHLRLFCDFPRGPVVLRNSP